MTLALILAALFAGLFVGIRLGRRGMIEVQTVLDLIAGADAPQFGPPCIHPGCLWARAKFRAGLNEAAGREVV